MATKTKTAGQLAEAAVIALDKATDATPDNTDAHDAIEQAVDLLGQIEDAAIREVREMLAKRLQKMTTKGERQNLIECYTDPGCEPTFEPSAEFLAGMKFAAELVGDRNFDY